MVCGSYKIIKMLLSALLNVQATEIPSTVVSVKPYGRPYSYNATAAPVPGPGPTGTTGDRCMFCDGFTVPRPLYGSLCTKAV